MHTTFAFLTKHPKLTTAEFIDYYENKNIPLINRLAGLENQPLVYKRRYTDRDDPAYVFVKASIDGSGQPIAKPDSDTATSSGLQGGGDPTVAKGDNNDTGNIDFDVITELGFADKAARQSWLKAVGAGENGRMAAEDEARFLWRERTRAVIVEEKVSFG